MTLDHQSGKEKHILYIGGNPYESEIIFVKDFKEEKGSYKFLHKDYLGSILAISDEEGNKLEQRHYDAWGNLTHLQIGNGEVITDPEQIAKAQLLLDRGYTSHEHLWEVGIIHMNGRLYDPLLRRFLNADENIQAPHNTQNYNKYGYVFNNPLMYNDPSGEFIFTTLAAWLGSKLIAAAVIGAAVGLASYTIGLAVTGNLHQWNIGGALKSTFWGAVSGAVSFGLGELFSAGSVVKALGDAKFLVQAAAHGVSQGVLSVMQGGDFLNGAAGGFFGSLGAELWGGAMKNLGYEKFAQSTIGTVAFGALSGGIGAELSGGNFWQGAVTGGIVAGLNHVAHSPNSPWNNSRGGEGKANIRIQRKEPWDLNGDGILQKSEADRWWLIGKGQSIRVNNSLIKWTGLRMPANTPINSRFNVETHIAFIDLPYETAATYGGTSFIRTGVYTAEVQNQLYHYNMRSGGSLLYGKDYMIEYENPTINFRYDYNAMRNTGSLIAY